MAMRIRSYALCLLLGLGMAVKAQVSVEVSGACLLPIGGLGDLPADQEELPERMRPNTFNMGRGMGVGVSIGGTLSGPFGIELRCAYLSGTRQSEDLAYSRNFHDVRMTREWKGSYLLLQPALRLSTAGDRWKGYMAVGPTLAHSLTASCSSVTTDDHHDPRLPYPNGEKIEVRYAQDFREGLGVGGFGAWGVVWRSKGVFGAFAELQVTALSWAPRRSTNERSQRSTAPDGRVTTYSYTSTTDYVATEDVEDSDDAARIFLPMSTWGLRIGVRLDLAGGGGAERPEAPGPAGP